MNTKTEDQDQNMETTAEGTTEKTSAEAEAVVVAPLEKEPKFKVISIDKTMAPSGMEGDNWFRYVIGQGTSKIEGLTMGNLTNVTAHAEAIAFDLNGRSKGGSNSQKANKSKATPPNPPPPETKS